VYYFNAFSTLKFNEEFSVVDGLLYEFINKLICSIAYFWDNPVYD